jgi:hypothetical protein
MLKFSQQGFNKWDSDTRIGVELDREARQVGMFTSSAIQDSAK